MSMSHLGFQDDAHGGGVGQKRKRLVEVRRDCPYLDTVNRQVLDFDFRKLCSVSLSDLNVYACLVCGKFFQGRGQRSQVYTHSLEAEHHVFINLETEKFYCIPEGYEIEDPSLYDIRNVLNPRFSKEEIQQIDKNNLWSRALDGSNYIPGMVGLNNINLETDFVNVAIQSLMRVTQLRDFFLILENYQLCKSPIVHRFGELTRKIWHARNYKGHVSPHEFLQAVKTCKKWSQICQHSNPVEFMSWLLNKLHKGLIGTSKKNTTTSSIIHECFQGELEVAKEIINPDSTTTETCRMPFLMLGLDLPPPPLFKDVMEKNIIPQVALFNLLNKFDGKTVTEVVLNLSSVARMRYRITRLPRYLIFHVGRFAKKDFFTEKNPTLVSFPVKNLVLKDNMLKKYDLIANVVHDGKPEEGIYKVFVQHKSDELWYEMQDLHVQEVLPQIVALSEAYLQIYEQHVLQVPES
ncbi:hypothetical protein Ddye_027345 [Dipteronia dyeriana]|uniref:U4/U6.U5 tri-snRNP-associated protein 2 n=1 Tax=Dipteronia dyeriana TaxID=168575 RepID=A0AAD9TPV6_9ROSI|nr:hypothetical protein Ddye_027345 [Dipteronia dyeriana]